MRRLILLLVACLMGLVGEAAAQCGARASAKSAYSNSQASSSFSCANGCSPGQAMMMAHYRSQSFARQQALASQSAKNRAQLMAVRKRNARQRRAATLARQEQRHEGLAAKLGQSTTSRSEPVFEPIVEPRCAFRTWADTTGNYQTEAKLRAVTDVAVHLVKIDGTKVVVPINKLSDSDQQWLVRNHSSADALLAMR